MDECFVVSWEDIANRVTHVITAVDKYYIKTKQCNTVPVNVLTRGTLAQHNFLSMVGNVGVAMFL